jgi:DNA processing protein
MTLETALRWSWMNVLTKKRYDLLLSQHGNLDSALACISQEMLSEMGCREETVLLALNRLEELNLEYYQKELEKRSLRLMTLEDSDYPDALRTIEDPPVFLYVRGDLSVLSQPCLAMVGTRAMSEYGKRVTSMLIPEIVGAGMVTVSGLAQGIDGEVARETLASGGKTVAIVGHGLGMIYPKAHEKLADEIVRSGGLILSEFPLDTHPDKYTFPARNRIIAALSLGTVVLEAAMDSGSLITADLALGYNREVFAVPGSIFDPNYAGCHQLLIRGHAKLVRSAQDIFDEIGIVSHQVSSEQSYASENPDEQAILSVLTSMPKNIDDIAEETQMEIGVITSILTILELQGILKNVGGGRWVKGR